MRRHNHHFLIILLFDAFEGQILRVRQPPEHENDEILPRRLQNGLGHRVHIPADGFFGRRAFEVREHVAGTGLGHEEEIVFLGFESFGLEFETGRIVFVGSFLWILVRLCVCIGKCFVIWVNTENKMFGKGKKYENLMTPIVKRCKTKIHTLTELVKRKSAPQVTLVLLVEQTLQVLREQRHIPRVHVMQLLLSSYKETSLHLAQVHLRPKSNPKPPSSEKNPQYPTPISHPSSPHCE